MNGKSVSIIGTGDFARALGKRLVYSGHTVICGSRNPKAQNLANIDPALQEVKVTTIKDCITQSDVIFLAIPVEAHPSMKEYASLLEGKVLVDISNPVSEDQIPQGSSIVETLAGLVPGAKLVKAFNTLSAYGLEVDASITTGNREVFVSSDHPEAKVKVMQLARNLGFTSVDYGGLKMSRELERMPILLFHGWGVATKVTVVLFIMWLILGYLRYYILKSPPFKAHQFLVNFLNKVMGCMGVSLLCACFLPGCFAAFIQMWNGTKYARFVPWLDGWLRMRKQLGLYGLMFAAVHMCMSLLLITPAYFPGWFVNSSTTLTLHDASTVTIPTGSIMSLKGERRANTSQKGGVPYHVRNCKILVLWTY